MLKTRQKVSSVFSSCNVKHKINIHVVWPYLCCWPIASLLLSQCFHLHKYPNRKALNYYNSKPTGCGSKEVTGWNCGGVVLINKTDGRHFSIILISHRKGKQEACNWIFLGLLKAEPCFFGDVLWQKPVVHLKKWKGFFPLFQWKPALRLFGPFLQKAPYVDLCSSKVNNSEVFLFNTSLCFLFLHHIAGDE